MRLIKLKVYSSLDDSIIRLIKFNPQGLSLIVDETNSKSSGSNIGKTTAVKVIDLCLGAKSVSSIYKEGDTGETHKVCNTYPCVHVSDRLSRILPEGCHNAAGAGTV